MLTAVCIAVAFCSSAPRPVRGPAPCCWPKLPIIMPDEPTPPRAVSSTPRAIGWARALVCLVRASGDESSALARRIAFASPPRPSQVWSTAPISSATIGGAVCWRRWAAGGQRRCERRSPAAEHAARGCVRLRKTGTRIVLRLVDEPGRPPAGLCDACIAIVDQLRACAALSDPFYVPYCGQMLPCVSSVTGSLVRPASVGIACCGRVMDADLE
jgi:hypothetical protein